MDHEEKSDITFAKAGYDSDDEEAATHGAPGWPRRGHIEFRDVTIRYEPDGADILSNINLTIRAGERVAIVGRTASGKSTVSELLLVSERPHGPSRTLKSS